MTIYIFGNEDEPSDNIPLKLLNYLRTAFSQFKFKEIKPNQDVEFEGEDCVYIIDSMEGITELQIFTESDLDNVAALSRNTVHDYDLGFQLKYLVKLGKIKKVKILAIPMNQDLDFSTFQFIFKKFVAQDIHGS